jgi:hypothetical protein
MLNTNQAYFFIFIILLFQCNAFASKKGDFRSFVKKGDWADPSSWQIFNGANWIASDRVPIQDDNVLIDGETEINIDKNSECKNLSFANNSGNSQINLNHANASLSIYGNAVFKDGINSIKSWNKSAKIIFKGSAVQTLQTGLKSRFFAIEVHKTAGMLLQKGGKVIALEKGFTILGKSKVLWEKGTCIEGLQFEDGTSFSHPDVFIDEEAIFTLSGSSYIRKGDSGNESIGRLEILGVLNLNCNNQIGINIGNTIVGGGEKPALLNVYGFWISGNLSFEEIKIKDGGQYVIAPNSINKLSNGKLICEDGSTVVYGKDCAENLPIENVDYFDLSLKKSAVWALSEDRVIRNNLLIDSAAIIILEGQSDPSSVLKEFRVKGSINIDHESSLKFKHLNLFLEHDLILENGSFDGNASKSVNTLNHFIGGNLEVKKGTVILSSESGSPSLHINGDVIIRKEAEFIGSSHPSGNPLLRIQGGIFTHKDGMFKSGSFTKPNKTSLFNIIFSNDSGWNKKSFLSVNENINVFETLWRFTIQSGRAIQLKSNIALGGISTETSFTSISIQEDARLNSDVFVIRSTNEMADSRFIMMSDAVLEIGHPNGIANFPLLKGAVQTSKRKYLETANYSYTGETSQITGDGLPTNIKNLVINNTGVMGNNTVSLSNSHLSIGGNMCTILQGIFDVDTNTFVGHNCILAMNGGVLKVSKTSRNIVLPELKGRYDLKDGTIEFSGNGNQVIRGSIEYFNLKVSGKNYLGTSFKNLSSHTSIQNNLDISDDAILDAVDIAGNSVSITGPGGLTMSGNSWFRLKKLNATLPELKASAPGADYKLSGGTIELYGTDSGQTHSLNGSKGFKGADIGYFNVVLNARSLNSKAANVVLQSSIIIKNNFIVNAPASFQIGNTFSLKGTGNFELKADATLQYGSPNGISTIPNTGNIRLTGNIKFSKKTNFGLVGSVEMVTGNLLPDTIQDLFIRKKNAVSCKISKALNILGKVNFENGIVFTTDSLFLKFLPKASTSGASDVSYVSGPVCKMGGTPFVFPIGKNGYYRPIAISAPANTNESITATYYLADPSQLYGTKLEDGIDHVSKCEYWAMEGTPFNSNPSISLSWNETSCGINSPQDLRVVHWENEMWTNDGNIGTTQPPYNPGFLKSKTITGFKNIRPFTFASISSLNPLPIELISFEGQSHEGHIILTWVTASEINNDYFSLERSSNGSDFVSLGKVSGSVNSMVKKEYNYSDRNNTAGIYYYRLFQTDRDGNKKKVSELSLTIKRVGLILSNFYFEENFLNLDLSDSYDGVKKIVIFDVLGREINSLETVEKTIKIPLNHMANETLYFIQITSGTDRIMKKVVYNH